MSICTPTGLSFYLYSVVHSAWIEVRKEAFEDEEGYYDQEEDLKKAKELGDYDSYYHAIYPSIG